mmetsp:Transcript_23785/g.42790  ORF Transcript_23785/g.42790 Transcript_23785/m.42790 type:complete len:217 (-) Transcript_23785:2554-3204(-)
MPPVTHRPIVIGSMISVPFEGFGFGQRLLGHRHDQRHRHRVVQVQPEGPRIAHRLQDQPRAEHRKGHRHNQLAGPDRQRDIDGAVAAAKGARAIERAVKMRPTAPDQGDHQDQDQQHRHQFKEPQPAPFHGPDYDVHADVVAVALHVRHPHDRNQGHQHLNEVHIAQQRFFKELAPRDRVGRQKHQGKGRQPAEQRHHLLDGLKPPIQPAEQAAVF